jgi:hypothetical protein
MKKLMTRLESDEYHDEKLHNTLVEWARAAK